MTTMTDIDFRPLTVPVSSQGRKETDDMTTMTDIDFRPLTVPVSVAHLLDLAGPIGARSDRVRRRLEEGAR